MTNPLIQEIELTIQRHEQARDFLKEGIPLHGREVTIIRELGELKQLAMAEQRRIIKELEENLFGCARVVAVKIVKNE